MNKRAGRRKGSRQRGICMEEPEEGECGEARELTVVLGQWLDHSVQS